ncbi:MAG: winged helix-turn-helix transcriptional regulator [Candidatus Heimdallarchaeota archaeon]|nr:winged helix-turn-helix transcriptional regulator [Candidatus Heimdallarchaeota archaeon]MCK4611037.1 winged helix-turn-helix transcriptional regulator [Candidatus Heimdallarchaeota archaeon]
MKEETVMTSEDIKITDTEKRILFLLSKNEFMIKEISFIFNRDASTIRSHLHTLRNKGLVIDSNNPFPSNNKHYTITSKAQRLLSEEKD